MQPADSSTGLLVVGDENAAERLEASLDSTSVTAVERVVDVAGALDGSVDCVVTRQTLPDGTGFEVHEVVSEVDPEVGVVLVAEPTGDVAAEAVGRGLTGFVPLEAGRPAERLVETVRDALGNGTASTTGGDPPADRDAAAWKADILDQLFARAPVHLYVKDDAARHVLVSGAQVDDSETVVGTTDLESGLVRPEEAEEGYEDDLRVLETGESVIDQEEYYPSSDEWYLTSKVPRYDADGNIVGLIGVSREITDRKAAQEQLEALNERLETFVSVVSHDLRNPLNVAQGRVDIERADRDSEHLEAASRAHSRMETLIEDLLTIARDGPEVDERDYGRLALSDLARSCWAAVSTDDDDLTVADDLVFDGVESRVKQLFENLFRNAIEHGSPDEVTAADHTVSIEVGALPDGDGFYVEDDGAGIPESEREAVFESGYSTSTSGTGFGLTIVRDVVDAHDWAISVTAADSGGARFEVTGVDSGA